MSSTAERELEARLDAHRRVLRWLLPRVVTSRETFDELLATLDQSAIPQDHQEDPGAVPTEGFGLAAAFAAEMRAVLDPLKARYAGKPSS